MEMKPWQYLLNEEYIGIRFLNDEPAYISIMGNGGMEFGFDMYFSENSFCESLLHLQSIKESGSDEHCMFLQNCIVMMVERKEEMLPEQREIVEKTGGICDHDGKCICFESHARGYFPYLPNQSEVLGCIRYLEMVLEALPEVEKRQKNGEHRVNSCYMYSQTSKGWDLERTMLNVGEMIHLYEGALQPELSSGIRSKKSIRQRWEADIFLSYGKIDDEEYPNTLFPYIFVVLDHRDGSFIYQEVLRPEDGFISVCHMLTDLMDRIGSPGEIYVSDLAMREGLCSLEKYGIRVRICSPGEIFFLHDFRIHFQEGVQRGSNDEKLADELLRELDLDPMSIAKAIEEGGQRELYSMIRKKLEDKYDLDELWDPGEPDQEDEMIEDFLPTMRRKLEAIQEFYENTDALEEEYDEDETDDWYEDEYEPFDGMINAAWMEDWAEILKYCSKEILSEHAHRLGIPVKSGSRKNTIISAVAEELRQNPQKVKYLLTADELLALRKLRTLANSGKTEFNDETAYTLDVLQGLVKKGIADLRYSHTSYALMLTLLLPQKLKGLKLDPEGYKRIK